MTHPRSLIAAICAALLVPLAGCSAATPAAPVVPISSSGDPAAPTTVSPGAIASSAARSVGAPSAQAVTASAPASGPAPTAGATATVPRTPRPTLAVNPAIPQADQLAAWTLLTDTFPAVRDELTSNPAADLKRYDEIFTPQLADMYRQITQRGRSAGLKQVGHTKIEVQVMDVWDKGGYRLLACFDQSGAQRVNVKTGAVEPRPDAYVPRSLNEFHIVRAGSGFKIAEFGTDGRAC